MDEERLVRIPTGQERDDLLPLFLLADDSEQQVRSYYQQGTLFALCGPDRAVRAIVLTIATGHDGIEIKSIAVVPGLQRRGLGTRLLLLVLVELRAEGVRRVTVATGNSSIGELAFYQRAGFRLSRIDRDYFNEARGYRKGLEENGIALRDLVWLDLEIQPDACVLASGSGSILIETRAGARSGSDSVSLTAPETAPAVQGDDAELRL